MPGEEENDDFMGGAAEFGATIPPDIFGGPEPRGIGDWDYYTDKYDVECVFFTGGRIQDCSPDVGPPYPVLGWVEGMEPYDLTYSEMMELAQSAGGRETISGLVSGEELGDGDVIVNGTIFLGEAGREYLAQRYAEKHPDKPAGADGAVAVVAVAAAAAAGFVGLVTLGGVVYYVWGR